MFEEERPLSAFTIGLMSSGEDEMESTELFVNDEPMLGKKRLELDSTVRIILRYVHI